MAVSVIRMDKMVLKLYNYMYQIFEDGWELFKCLLFQKTRLLFKLETEQSDSLILNLIKAGANVNTQNNLGVTPLHLAVCRSTIDVAHELIKKGADINAQDYENSTPLHYAAEAKNLEAVCMLLYYNVDINIMSRKYKLTFTYALETLRFDIADILVNYYNDGFDNLLEVSAISHSIANKILNVNGTCFGCGAFQCYANFDDAFYFSYYYAISERYIVLRILHPLLLECTDSRFHSCSNAEWLKYMYVTLKASIAIDLTTPIKKWTKSIPVYCNDINFFRNLYYSFYIRDITPNDRLTVTYICLGLGIPTQLDDISFVWHFYGFNEELDALLFGTTYYDESEKLNSVVFYPLPFFILALDKNYSSKLIFRLFKKQIKDFSFHMPVEVRLKGIINSLSYFSLPFDNKQQLLVLWQKQTNSHFEEFSKRLNEIPQVPSLIEISRNKSRVFIKQKFNIKKPYHFHDAVKSLGLPTAIADIIRFKSPIYI